MCSVHFIRIFLVEKDILAWRWHIWNDYWVTKHIRFRPMDTNSKVFLVMGLTVVKIWPDDGAKWVIYSESQENASSTCFSGLTMLTSLRPRPQQGKSLIKCIHFAFLYSATSVFVAAGQYATHSSKHECKQHHCEKINIHRQQKKAVCPVSIVNLQSASSIRWLQLENLLARAVSAVSKLGCAEGKRLKRWRWREAVPRDRMTGIGEFAVP